jgi:type IV secretory pathway ATPase VirB11/archaellum biosynthesis ATPase
VNGWDYLGAVDLSEFSTEDLLDTLAGVRAGQDMFFRLAKSGDFTEIRNALDSGNARLATPISGSPNPIIDRLESNWLETGRALGVLALCQMANAVDGWRLDEPGNFFNYWGMSEVYRHQRLINNIIEELEERGVDPDSPAPPPEPTPEPTPTPTPSPAPTPTPPLA